MQVQGLDQLAGWKPGAAGFLSAILECVAQPVWVVDNSGVILFANPAALRTLGYGDLEELRGKPSHDTIHYKYPDGRPFPASECPMLRPRVTGETIRREEDWFFRKDGTMFPVSYTSAPIEMPFGRGAVVAFRDITERRRVEQALRESEVIAARSAEVRASELRFRAMLDAAFDAIVSTDHELGVTYFNAAAERTFGYSTEEALGRELLTLIIPPRLQDFYRRWWRKRQREDREVLARANEAVARNADGTEFPIEFAVARMSLPGPTVYTAYYRDITERHHAERELRGARRRVIEAA